ncbi:transcription factor S [Candidatus Woesearchaeota archaeon]|nr:transcription factor S [Candidatus Woesearchaeota archaeon]
MFCKQCGSILMPTKVKDKTVMFCKKCGDSGQKADIKLKDIVKHDHVKSAGVVEEEKEAYPLIEFSGCKKCGHKRAYFWTVQTRASDEPETKFYKCEKCKSVTRDYS